MKFVLGNNFLGVELLYLSHDELQKWPVQICRHTAMSIAAACCEQQRALAYECVTHARATRFRGVFSVSTPSNANELFWVSVVGSREDKLANSHLDIPHTDISLVGDVHGVGDYLTLVGEIVHVGVI